MQRKENVTVSTPQKINVGDPNIFGSLNLSPVGMNNIHLEATGTVTPSLRCAIRALVIYFTIATEHSRSSILKRYLHSISTILFNILHTVHRP